MQLQTILQRVQRHKSFVYRKASLRDTDKGPSLDVRIGPRANGKPACSGCGRKRPGYDRLRARRYRVDRIAEDLFGASGRSALRLAAGVAAAFGLLGFVPLGLILIHGRPNGPGSELIPLLLLFLAFCSTLLAQGMRQALLGPTGCSWLRAGLVAVAA
jgi:hypothetical protein